jgi:hypothetical protein
VTGDSEEQQVPESEESKEQSTSVGGELQEHHVPESNAILEQPSLEENPAEEDAVANGIQDNSVSVDIVLSPHLEQVSLQVI